MAGKEFTGKDKTVQKMTRDGLTEENLHDGSVKNISKLDREGRPSKSFEMSLDHRHVNTASEDSAGKRNKKYRDKSGLAAEERIRSRDAPVDQMDIGPEENGVDGVGTEEAGTGRASQRRLMNYAGMHKKSAVADKEEVADNLSEARDRGYSRKLRSHEMTPDAEDLSEQKSAMKKKQMRKRLTEEQKKAGRLSFDDEGGDMVKGSGMGIGKNATGAAVSMTAGYVRGRFKDDMDENAAVDGASAAELAAEDAARSLRNAQLKSNRTQGRRGRLKMSDADEVTDRLKFGANDVELSGEAAERVKSAANSKEAAKKAAQRKEMNRFFQRKRYKDAYKVARSGEVVVGQGANAVVQESITVKAKRAAKELLI